MLDFSTIGRRVATQVTNNALQKVAGNIKGIITGESKGANSSDFYKVNTPQIDVKTFQFPLDVMGEPGLGNFGHYMMFYINEQQDATLRFAGAREKPETSDYNVKRELRRRKTPSYINKMKRDLKSGKATPKKEKYINSLEGMLETGSPLNKFFQAEIERTTSSMNDEYGGEQVISVERNATHRLNTAIALYMPQQLNFTYGARYVETDIAPLGAAAGEVVVGIENKSIKSASDAYEVVKGRLPDEFKRRVILGGLKAVDGFGLTGLREAYEITKGEVITERMELAFKNINRRVFTYNFKLIPKNKKEADEIRKIIYAFKFNMMPEMRGSMGRKGGVMSFPNTFDIEYMYAGKENDYISRVSTCVLENMTVSYGGDRFKTFSATTDGAPVVETSINLAFKELELITRERVGEGF